ncbi:hypothetical protein [Bdellovibrio bacteriovorus]|nr:hypothetical protein [Bdellovibrio bacteriovorus]
MKKLITMVLTVFALAACQPGNDGGGNNTVTNPGQIATTPLQLPCINGTAYCNNGAYANYQGWMPYPGMYNYAYNYSNIFAQQGFCGCPSGYLPTYNGTFGLGCVQQQLIMPYWNDYFFWSYGYGWGFGYMSIPSAPQMTINHPQYSNIPTNSNSFSSCSQTLTQSCVLSQGNTCGVGATCRQVLSGSNLGVCVKN